MKIQNWEIKDEAIIGKRLEHRVYIANLHPKAILLHLLIEGIGEKTFEFAYNHPEAQKIYDSISINKTKNPHALDDSCKDSW